MAKKSGPGMRFDHFMEMALYHPEWGYYATSGRDRIGRGGDFYTSVSVGDVFGLLLSHAIEEKWGEICPSRDQPLVIVEQGAHDGQLALDILRAFRDRAPELFERIDYRIIDPREGHRQLVTENVGTAGLGDRVRLFGTMPEAAAEEGIFLCNELLDAFPVRRFVRWRGEWWEWYVVPGEGPGKGLACEPFPVDREEDEDFRRFEELVSPHAPFAEGYSTEFCPALRSWTEEASSLFNRGHWWIVDYGFEAEDYFAPSRRTGTIRCYHRHRAHEDPLFAPGENDITAHVNFTDLVRCFASAGVAFNGLVDQSKFLTGAGRDWLLGLDGRLPSKEDAGRLRQFQTLTHPSMMGRSFRVAGFSK